MRPLPRLVFLIMLVGSLVNAYAQDEPLPVCHGPNETTSKPCASQPRKLWIVYPDLTEEALREQQDWDIELSVMISKTGMPQDIRLVRAFGKGMDERAIAALKQFRFEPGTDENHNVVPVRGTLSLHMSCGGGRELYEYGAVRSVDYTAAENRNASKHPGDVFQDCRIDPKMLAKKSCAPLLVNRTTHFAEKDSEEAKAKGVVVLSVEIGQNGRVHVVRVVTPAEKELNEKAVAMAEEWVFRPALYKGQPIRVQATLEFYFWSCAAGPFWRGLN